MRILVFTACVLLGLAGLGSAQAHEEKLAGGEWVLQDEAGPHGPVLVFEAGRMSGTGGCNRFGGRYEERGDDLSFSAVAATRMACAPDVMRREQAFFGMLSQVRKRALSGDTLKLMDAAGGTLATFARRMAN